MESKEGFNFRVAVIGGCGFVGSHLIEDLAQRGHEVIIIDNFFLGKMSNVKDAMANHHIEIYREDATQCLILRSILALEKVDTVINLAMKCLPTSFLDPEGAYMVGVQIAHNLAYLLRQKVYTKLIHFSSSEAYGTAVRVPMDESHPTNPTVPYSAGKLAADLLLLSYYNTFGLDIGIVRPFNLIGEKQNWNNYAAVVPQTIKNILIKPTVQLPFITGNGLQTRDFTYVGDVTSVVARLVEQHNFEKLKGKIVNFGQGKETTIKEVVETICEEMDFPIEKIVYTPERAGDVLRHYADTTLANKLFGYRPSTDFSTAIAKTVEWFSQADLSAT